jgi:hypothetical protein
VSPPTAVLRSFISHYVGFCAHEVMPGIDVGLPSRHAHLIISLDSPIDVLQMPSHTQRAGRLRALVSGLHDAPAAVRRGGSQEIVHVFLLPAGLRAILHASPAELTSHVVELSDLWGRAAGWLYAADVDRDRASFLTRLRAVGRRSWRVTWH